jgi:tetratricopeptide (TPR) repeat protein
MVRAGSRRFLLLGATLAILGSLEGRAYAAEKEKLEQARRQYLAQEYERVVRLLQPLVGSPLATISEKVEAYELIGLSYLILGETKRAREAFENLLELDPGHVLRDPTGSPKIQRFYESVRESFLPGYRARAKVSLEHAAPSGAIAGRRVEVGARIAQGGAEVGQVLVRWRRAGMLSFASIGMRREGLSLAASFLSPTDTASYQLEYYLEVRDPNGQALTRVGSPDRPLLILVSGVAPRSESLIQKWWFWTAIGVAVVGGVTAGIVAGARETAPDGNLEPRRIQLP